MPLAYTQLITQTQRLLRSLGRSAPEIEKMRSPQIVAVAKAITRAINAELERKRPAAKAKPKKPSDEPAQWLAKDLLALRRSLLDRYRNTPYIHAIFQTEAQVRENMEVRP